MEPFKTSYTNPLQEGNPATLVEQLRGFMFASLGLGLGLILIGIYNLMYPSSSLASWGSMFSGLFMIATGYIAYERISRFAAILNILNATAVVIFVYKYTRLDHLRLFAMLAYIIIFGFAVFKLRFSNLNKEQIDRAKKEAIAGEYKTRYGFSFTDKGVWIVFWIFILSIVGSIAFALLYSQYFSK